MLDHYPLFLASEDTKGEIVYIFESDVHGEYYISFRPAPHRFTTGCDVCVFVHEINFTPVRAKDPGKGMDPRISATIIKAISVFLNETGYPILYLCDITDQRHESRSKLFTKWYAVSRVTGFQQAVSEFISFEVKYIVGVIGFASDPHFDKYILHLETYSQGESGWQS